MAKAKKKGSKEQRFRRCVRRLTPRLGKAAWPTCKKSVFKTKK